MQQNWKGVASYATVGLEFGLSLLVGLFGGRWIDGKLGKLRPRQELEAAEARFHDAAIEAAFRAALPLYDLQPWDGPLALFRPALDRRWKVSGGRWVDCEREYVFEDNDWTRWAPATRVFEVPGDHDSMVLEPNVRVLAARMRACIEAAEAPAATPFATAAE